MVYWMAREEFDRLHDYSDVYDKLNCLILTTHYITDAVIAFWKDKGQFKVDDFIISSDELLLILCYIVVESSVPFLFSEVNFIDDFMDEASMNAEPGFCLTTLRSTLLYILDTLDPNKLPGVSTNNDYNNSI